MNLFPDITILHKIYQSNHSEVYRGIWELKKQPIILKFLNLDYPTTAEITHYKQEYEITHKLNLEGVIKSYRLESYQGKFVIIFEDIGGDSLEILSASHSFNLAEILEIAIKTAQSLAAIHAANLIHKDINPANIVFNAKTGILKIIDFGIATELTRENPTLKSPNVLEGTLAYISPEQTGRMNRLLDYRTDFYSLGATLYKLLTKKLPFETNDPLDLVHCHIAKQPILPSKINPEIPEILSDIVMKLMAKIAEERYQSAFGLKADLENCLTQLQSHQRISVFPLATQDISDKFQISQKLYGRDQEICMLLAGFERISPPLSFSQAEKSFVNSNFHPPTSQSEIMLVAGYSGIGKSALVAEIYKPITSKRGYFITGKFDQFQRNIPYAAVVDAFKDLVKQLLTETQITLNQWRKKILAAVGNNGQLIINVIPEVELIIGQQTALPEVGSKEFENRFNLVFQKFIRVFCSKEHPLVIFLDDLQWADSASLKLVKLIMTDAQMHYLFLIGAYRDNEITPTHRLAIALDELRQEGAIIHQITLAPLQLLHISQLLADTLSRDSDSVQPLAEIIARKTEGNPFFMNEFLKTLYSENLLIFNWQNRCWEWKIQEIEQIEITDNVVTLLLNKLKKLQPSTQEILQLAACVGSEFDLKTLSIICEKSEKEIFSALKYVIPLGLIFPLTELDENLLIQNYKFQHDRVQQAAYALIDQAQTKNVHLQIGRLLLQKTAPESFSEKIFKIIDHLNLGSELISDSKERYQIAELNFIAGQKAKTASAYQAAFKYFQTGAKILEIDSWHTHYQKTLSLYECAAETAYLSGNFQESDYFIEVVLQHAKTALDAVKVYRVKIEAFMAQRQQLQALEIALKALEKLGVTFPAQPTPTDIQEAANLTASILVGKSSSDLLNLPFLTDTKVLAIIKLLSSVSPAAFQTTPVMFPLIVLKMVNLSVEHGNSNLAPFIYAVYGVILAGAFLDIESGFKFGQLGINLLEHLSAEKIECRTIHIYYAHLHFWKYPLRDCLYFLQKAYSLGLEFGDLEFSSYAANQNGVQAYLVGIPLREVQQKNINYIHDLEIFKQKNSSHYLQILLQAISNLIEEKIEEGSLLSGQFYDEVNNLSILYERNESTALFYVFFNKLILSYLFNNEESLQNTNSAKEFINAVTSLAVVPTFYFYDSLIRLRDYCNSIELQVEILEQVDQNQAKMKHWANSAPMNFLHKWYLVEAEKARVLENFLEAEHFYEEAINHARNHQYLQEEALAYELAAQFYLQRGLKRFAQTYMKEAHYTYERWGAKAKVKHLQATYPDLLTKSLSRTNFTDSLPKNFTTTTGSHSGEVLDLAAVMKASQAISSEIMLDKLLASLMKILIQTAGAQTGYLILEHENNWLIEASGSLDQENISVLNSISIENSLFVSSTIINYVARTQENIVLNDALNQGKFTNDPYIKKYEPKSILCMPLRDRGQVVGILYLENNLATGAFTADRLQILSLLSSQAAISITNARLYSQLENYSQMLEEKVEQRTAELTEATRKAEAANEAKSTFLANMSHELRSPLNAILGFAQLMLNQQNLNSEDQENLSIIARSGEHLLTLINQVLDLSKIEAGRTTLNESKFDLYQLLDNLEDMLTLKADEKKLKLVCDRASDVPRYVQTDEVKLRQVLINLLNNALKFTKEGGIILRVMAKSLTEKFVNTEPQSFSPDSESLFPLSTDFCLIFEVEDTGPGIAPEELNNLFEPFIQTQTGRNAAEGTGLGLPISRKFIELMGGEITVKSTLNQGTTFRFDIQVRALDYEQTECEKSTAQVIGLEPNQPRYRILIADDKQTNRQLLYKLLNPLGFDLKEAKNGREVLEIYHQWEPHLILMDLRMPEMDGYEATRQIKATEQGKNTAIIAITASAFEDERTRSVLAGCDDFMRKPFRAEDIFAALHQHIDVRYIYAEDTSIEAKISLEQNPQLLNLTALLALPNNLLNNLEASAKAADTTEVERYIDEIRGSNSDLANMLETWAFNFDYGMILSLIQEARALENKTDLKNTGYPEKLSENL